MARSRSFAARLAFFTALAFALALALPACAPSSDGGADISRRAGGRDPVVATIASALTVAEVQPFATPASWTESPLSGTIGTYFVDVTGDNRADLVALNEATILVRRAPASGTGFGSTETWNVGAFYGSKGTFFADVTGDGRADAVGVGDDYIGVLPSTGSAFGSYETWNVGAFYGSKGTFFTDVTGDGRADAVGVGDDYIGVLRSTGSAFGSYETWNVGAFYGSKGTFFADVTGDGRADAVGVGNDYIGVLRSTGSGFGAYETWSSAACWGERGTFVSDVTGDGLADVVAVNANDIRMHRSSRFFFGSKDEVMSTVSTTASVARGLADVTGDRRADYVEAPAASAAQVRVRQDRPIPVRFVQFVTGCDDPNMLNDTQIQNALVTTNKVYKEAGISFFPQPVLGPNDCSGHTTTQVVISAALADLSVSTGNGSTPDSQADLAEAVPFNSSCNLGYADFADLPENQQIWWVGGRCALSGEALVFIAPTGSGSAGNDPGAGNLVLMHPLNIAAGSEVNGLLAHELGHYLGLSHPYGNHGLGFDPSGYFDPDTGQGRVLSASWDLVAAPISGSLGTFNRRADAAAFETTLIPIQDWNVPGWYCPSGDVNKPCPASFLAGTIGVRAGGASGPVWWSGDPRLKGLALRLPTDGAHAVNIMTYNYSPDNADIYPGGLQARTPQISLSQIEQIQSALSNDLPTVFMGADGKPVFGDRPRLGITGSAPVPTYVMTSGVAKSGPGTLASNGADTWAVGLNAFDGNGNQVYQWNIQTRTWDAHPMGAQQIAVPSDGARKWPNVTPWAITGSGTVKRYDGSTFVEPPNSSGSCAISLAVGQSLSSLPRKYAWSVGCAPINFDGNRQIYRYRQVDGAGGWVPTTGYAVQVAVDGDGIPWARTIQGRVYRATLDGNDMPTTWTEYIPPGSGTTSYLTAGAHKNGRLPPNILGSNGHIYTWNFKVGSGWGDASTPPVTFDRLAGALPYLWALEPNGRIWYQR